MNEQVPKSHSEIYHAVDGRLEFSPYNAEPVLNMKLINGLGDLIPVRIFERDLVSLINQAVKEPSESYSGTKILNSCVVTPEEPEDSEPVVKDGSYESDTQNLENNESEKKADTLESFTGLEEIPSEVNNGADLSEEVPQDSDKNEIADDVTNMIEQQDDDPGEAPLDDDLERDDSLATTLLGYQPSSLTPDEAKAEALIAQQDQEASSLMSHFKESLGAKQTHITSDALPTGLDDGIRNRVTKTAEERQEILATEIDQTIQADKEQIY
ncbi:hypothetical protein HAU32_08440 [Weissella confusa]|uniref:Uncharacterized protein n=1 Tax=Weissella fermenti TaxID=2987699 RepID=A0ABT6D6Q3_9LACO|nr:MULTISPECIES: hypothetical protein [Weissella]MBJ7688999.1 hypothetical protein [Weissella confusa]MCW0928029.1 hypothetical protein [Weissella sp. LMG 11983]MDF9300619.1 hypothetical protein [Weissella sp. BK2]